MKGKSIHDPEFSEFGFGYTVTNGLTHFRVGTLSLWQTISRRAMRRFRHHFWDEHHIRFILEDEFGLTEDEARTVVNVVGAPFIPTQHLENTFPVDVALNSNGIFYFLQFKRSKNVSKTGNITEVKEGKFGDFTLPFYRVYFYGKPQKPNDSLKGDKKQRGSLAALEESLAHIPSALVRYAVPAFHTLQELSKVYQNGLAAYIDGRPPVMCIKASSFTLPGTRSHHISYDATGTAWRFSEYPEEVAKIQPLISEINEISPNAEPIGKAMQKLCETLDEHAKDMKLPKRPEKMDDEALLRMFGLRPIKETPEREDKSREMAFLQGPIVGQEGTKELANGIRKILNFSDDGEGAQRKDACQPIEFLENFYGADYRCQQILGHPLLVGIQNG